MAARKVNTIPPGADMARILSATPPETLVVKGIAGGVSVAPDAGIDVVFGRFPQGDASVPVGMDDTRVSREHGVISRERSRWVLHNHGNLPIRFPQSGMLFSGYHADLTASYLPLFIVNGVEREHLLEVWVVARRPANIPIVEPVRTEPRVWDLSPEERLVIVCLSQRYLRQDPQALPVTWNDIALELGDLRPGEQWDWKRASRAVERVRKRLRRDGVYGLVESEVPRPIGNQLNQNLIDQLLVKTTTITPMDLHLLGECPLTDACAAGCSWAESEPA